MGFHIVFIYYIKTVFVAQLIPARSVGIVRGSYGIDVVFLHHFNVVAHGFLGHIVTCATVKFMAVCTLENDSLAVYADNSVLDFNRSEADLLGDIFNRNAVVFKSEHNGVKVGAFSAPRLYVGNDCLERGYVVLSGVLRIKRNGCAVGIEHAHIYAESLIGSVGFDRYVEITVVKESVGLCVDFKIADVFLFGSVKVNIAENTRKAPHILTLEPGACAPAVNLNADNV